MSDRWDAKVWLYETAGDWDVYSEPGPDDPPEKWCRYIRADLYEQAEADRDDARARVEHLLTEICGGAANRHALAEHCREVTAERDRLRAAIEAAIAVLRNDLYTTRVREALGRLEEALSHD